MEEDSKPNGHGDSPLESLQANIRALEAMETPVLVRALESSMMLDRVRFAKMAGLTFDGKRDEYEILGYDRVITNNQYRAEYDRGGLAGRVVDVFPNATWRGGFELIEDEDPEASTAFEEAWVAIEKKHKLIGKLRRVDILSVMSEYAVLLIGARGDLSTPLPKATDGKAGGILYFQPYSGGGGPGLNSRQGSSAFDTSCTVKEYETNTQDERFGLPKSYTLKRAGVSAEGLKDVHWTRVIHIAEGLLEDDVFGQPALERPWNLFIDLRKVTGGGAEAFWLRANQGMQINLERDMKLEGVGPDGKTELERLKQEAEEYQHQIRRVLRTRGVNIEMLGSDVANFANPADAIITQIAGSKGIPKRILTGSEMGELASSQDRENWKDQIVGRQQQYADPYIVRPLVDRLIEYGYLPTPVKGPDTYAVRFSQIETLTQTERADGAVKWSQTKVDEEPVFTDAEIRDKWYQMEPLTDEQRAEIQDRADERFKRQQEVIKAKQPAPGFKTAPNDPNLPVNDDRQARLAATRKGEGPIHLVADQHVLAFQRLMLRAFGRARKALGQEKPNANNAVAALQRVMKVSARRLLLNTLESGGRATANQLNQHRVATSGKRNLADDKFDFKRDSAAVDWADRHAGEMITNISESTRESINNAIAEAVEHGNIKDAYKEILDAIGDEDRARTIARHETMMAASEGQREAWSQAVDEGVLTGNEKRTWIAVGDGLMPDGEICNVLDGQSVEIDEDYSEGIEGPPAHVNCRCTEGLVYGDRELGDAPGHPFHGNQWGDEGGGGDPKTEKAGEKIVGSVLKGERLRVETQIKVKLATETTTANQQESNARSEAKALHNAIGRSMSNRGWNSERNQPAKWTIFTKEGESNQYRLRDPEFIRGETSRTEAGRGAGYFRVSFGLN